MRDFAVALTIMGSLPLILIRPYVGIVMWFWVSLMNPHRLTWGYAYAMHPALVIALFTVVAVAISSEPKRPPGGMLTIMLAALTAWFTICLPFAEAPDAAYIKWEEVIKILGMSFVTTCVVRSRERIWFLVWVFALSIGVYGIKGGIFTILHGGEFRVWGPPGSFIEDNNQLAIALVMVLPLFAFLRMHSEKRWLRLALLGALALVFISVLGSRSRGALLGLLPAALLIALKSKRPIAMGVIVGTFGCAAILAMPDVRWERMGTIFTYNTDASALDRLWEWDYAIRLLHDFPIFGAGFQVFENTALFAKYYPDPSQLEYFVLGKNFHSIYFQMLAENGYLGLVIFVALIVTSLTTAARIRRRTRFYPELAWARDLASMIQVSIASYAIGGAFHNLGFYDLYYALLAMMISLKYVVDSELATVARPAIARPPARVELPRFRPQIPAA